MKLNLSREWLIRAAESEDGCCVTAISPELLALLEGDTMSKDLLNLATTPMAEWVTQQQAPSEETERITRLALAIGWTLDDSDHFDCPQWANDLMFRDALLEWLLSNGYFISEVSKNNGQYWVGIDKTIGSCSWDALAESFTEAFLAAADKAIKGELP